jgi:V-type H+-transporting ATPase subunit G
MSNTPGIQTLLEAEKEASKIVEKAKLYRTQRLKDARVEAQMEIDKLKQQKQQEFKEYEMKVTL